MLKGYEWETHRKSVNKNIKKLLAPMVPKFVNEVLDDLAMNPKQSYLFASNFLPND